MVSGEMMRSLFIPVALFFLLTAAAARTVIHVPGDYATIQSALNAAAAGDSIFVAPGVYMEKIIWPDVNGIQLISRGDTSNTLIDGSYQGPVLYMPSSSHNDMSTLIKGFAFIHGGNVPDGGGIFLGNSSPRIENCLIRDCSAGGGLYLLNSSPQINDLVIRDVTGEGISCIENSSPSMYRLTVSGCRTLGNGIYCVGQSSPIISEAVIENNDAGGRDGGGLSCWNQSSPTLTNVVVRNNTGNSGGGIYVDYDCSITIVHSLISGNWSHGDGGGLHGGRMNITDTKIIGNRADGLGGGIYSIALGEGILLRDCVISQNRSELRGGGIYFYNNTTPILYKSSLCQNRAPAGSAIYSDLGSPMIRNCTFADNFDAAGSGALHCNFSSAKIKQSNLSDNGWAVYNPTNAVIVQADSNYWGHATGPYQANENNTGRGDTLSNFIAFLPFLNSPDSQAPPLPVHNVRASRIAANSIALGWDPSHLTDLGGYKIYFDTDSSGYPYQHVIDVGIVTHDTLSNLMSGITYRMAITVYDAQGNESWYSREIALPLAAGLLKLNVQAEQGVIVKNPDQDGYDYGNEVKLTATAAEGYTFSGWAGDASGSENPLTVIMDRSKSITAQFSPNSYVLNVNASNGSVTKNPDRASYEYGSQVSLTASAAEGFIFTGWSGDAAGSDNPLTVVMNSPKTITANFAVQTFALTVNAANGSISKSPDQDRYEYGSPVVLTAAAAAGYTFSGWSGDATSSENPLTVLMNADKTISANFTVNYYALILYAQNGIITKSPDLAQYPYGSRVSLTAIPTANYAFTYWGDDATGSANPLTITIDGDKTVTAHFALNTYALIVEATNGTVMRSPDQANYDADSRVVLTAIPAQGYRFDDWSGDESGSDNPLTITMNENKIITANFTIKTHTLTVDAVHGTVKKEPDQAAYPYGSHVLLTATAAEGYTFTSWSGDAAGATNPLTLLMDDDKVIVANFALNRYSLTVQAQNGSVAIEPDEESYTADSRVVLTAIPLGDYVFTNWSGDATGSNNPLTVTMSGNKTITAHFEAIRYSLTAHTLNGSVTKNPDLTSYEIGSWVELTAVPAAGYVFANWSGDTSATANPLLVRIDHNKVLFANFVLNDQSIPFLLPSIAEAPTPALRVGEEWQLDVVVGDEALPVHDLHTVSATLDFSASHGRIEVVAEQAGPFMGSGTFFFTTRDNAHDTLRILLSRPPAQSGVDGYGVIARVTFRNRQTMPSSDYIRMITRRVRGVNSKGGEVPLRGSNFIAAVPATADFPDGYSLGQNYPNPFNPITTIEFTLPVPGPATLTIYTLLGEEVEELVNGRVSAGIHRVQWDAGDRPNGVYIYVLRVGSYRQIRKAVLMK